MVIRKPEIKEQIWLLEVSNQYLADKQLNKQRIAVISLVTKRWSMSKQCKRVAVNRIQFQVIVLAFSPYLPMPVFLVKIKTQDYNFSLFISKQQKVNHEKT